MKQLHSLKGFVPFDPDYYGNLEKLLGQSCKINYFDADGTVADASGRLTDFLRPDDFAHFVVLDEEVALRSDRIITLNGRPGPAFEEYDLYALQCLTCMGGM